MNADAESSGGDKTLMVGIKVVSALESLGVPSRCLHGKDSVQKISLRAERFCVLVVTAANPVCCDPILEFGFVVGIPAIDVVHIV